MVRTCSIENSGGRFSSAIWVWNLSAISPRKPNRPGVFVGLLSTALSWRPSRSSRPRAVISIVVIGNISDFIQFRRSGVAVSCNANCLPVRFVAKPTIHLAGRGVLLVGLQSLTVHFDNSRDRRAQRMGSDNNGIGGRNMVREIEYRGETFRVTAHGIAGHEEIFIVHIEADDMEGGEISIDRMTEENDTSAPLQDIIILLCDRLIPERSIDVRNPNGPFSWRQGNVQFAVHDGVQERH